MASEAVWRAPGSRLGLPGGGAAVLGGSLHFCQSCLQPWSFPPTPLLGSTELHPSPSPCRQAAPFAGISFNLKQVPGIPALAESTLPPTRPVPRRLLPCLFMEVESPAQGSCLIHVPRNWEAETIQRKHECPTQTQKAKFTRSHIITVVITNTNPSPGLCHLFPPGPSTSVPGDSL